MMRTFIVVIELGFLRSGGGFASVVWRISLEISNEDAVETMENRSADADI
jgi:hypothetical protein